MTTPVKSADHPAFHCGFAAILGRPNAGKSTLLNRLLGEKIAIVSAKPQTTRDRIRGILSRDDFQIIFIDTPGIIEPHDRLNEALMVNVREALDGIDVALHLIDVTEPPEISDAEAAVIGAIPCPRILVPTKIDRLANPNDLAHWRSKAAFDFPETVIPVSAVAGEGITELIEAVRGHLPEGPALFDPEDLTDRDLRFLAAEAIREKVFELTGQELPYATAVMIDEFSEREDAKTLIAATIHVERESQKGMVVGKGGRMVRDIGQAARRDIEALMGGGVFLDLRVKVRKNWRKRDADLRRFGYRPPPPGKRRA